MTANELIEAWAARDRRYAGTAHYQRRLFVPTLTASAEGAIREYRMREVDGLPPGERARAWGVLRAWMPPGTRP